MRKHLLTTVCVLALATTASATQSRINSMGGGVKQFTVLDDRNIFQLPAELVKWGTWTGLEIGGPGYTSFGIHYNFNPTAILAIYGTSENKPATTILGYGGAAGAISQVSNPIADTGDGNTHKLTALFGLDLGSTRLGFGFGLWGDKTSTFDDGGEIDNFGPLVLDVLFGLGFAMGSADLDIGLDFKYRTPTDVGIDGADTGVVLSNHNQIDIGLLGRLTVPFSGPHEVVAFLGFNMAFGSGQRTADDSDALSGVVYNIAMGTDIRLNLAEGIIVQPGIGIAFGGGSVTRINANDDIFTDSRTNLVIPFYNVAVDVQVTEWLDIRFGGGQSVIFTTTNAFSDIEDVGSSDSGASSSDVAHNIATGVGFNLPAGVSLDIDVNTTWWQKGPYFLSGDGGAGGFGVSAALHKDW